MPRLPRIDRPGRIHHVMNRGLARRTVFETRRDVRYFLSLLARAARAGRIEVLAFAILTTHFHLLVRSRDGELSETMRQILNAYVRWFNRSRRRDGPLFRGRFRSIPVESPRQLWYTVRYIDANPVEARLVARAEEYPYGSARLHAGLARRPRWVDGSLIDRAVEAGVRERLSRAAAYGRAFPPRLAPRLRRFVAARLSGCRRDAEGVVDLVAMSDARLQEWMCRKASLGDGSRAGIPLVAADAILDAIAGWARARAGMAAGPASGCDMPALSLLRAGLLRDLAGERVCDVARRLGRSAPTVSRLHDAHRRCLGADEEYRRIVLEVTRAALACDEGDAGIDGALGCFFGNEARALPM